MKRPVVWALTAVVVALVAVLVWTKGSDESFASGAVEDDGGGARRWTARDDEGGVCVQIDDGASVCHDDPRSGEMGVSIAIYRATSALAGAAPLGSKEVRVEFSATDSEQLPVVEREDGSVGFAWASGYMDTDSVPVTVVAVDAAGDLIGRVPVDLIVPGRYVE